MGAVDVHVCDADLGAGVSGAGLGPYAVLTAAAETGLDLRPRQVIRGPARRTHLGYPSIRSLARLIEPAEAQCVAMNESLRAGRRVLALSGDHANAVGWIAGVREAYPRGRVGVVWIDAHGDLHTPGTSPSGNVHGMPVAALLGCDDRATSRPVDFPTLRAWRRWQRIGGTHAWPKLFPEDVVMVDIRDLEAEEWQRIDALGVRHFTPVKRQVWGIDRLIAELRQTFADHDAVFVSFDVDALDAALVPGTGTPVEGGLDLADAGALLSALVALPNFVGLEIAEVNPLLDVGNQVARQVAGLLAEAWPALRQSPVDEALRHLVADPGGHRTAAAR